MTWVYMYITGHIYEMNFTLCVLLVYNDNGSVHCQTLCTDPLSIKTNNTQRVKFILYIYILFMYLDCVLSIAFFKIAVFISVNIAVACLDSKRQMFNFVFVHSGTLK